MLAHKSRALKKTKESFYDLATFARTGERCSDQFQDVSRMADKSGCRLQLNQSKSQKAFRTALMELWNENSTRGRLKRRIPIPIRKNPISMIMKASNILHNAASHKSHGLGPHGTRTTFAPAMPLFYFLSFYMLK